MNNNKKKRILIVIISVCALIIGTAIFFIASKNESMDVQLIDKSSSEYIVMNVHSKHSFNVVKSEKNPEHIEVLDLDKNPVAIRIEEHGSDIEIKAPQEGYEKGEVYTLDITDIGHFDDEKLKKAKKIVFVIESKNKANITYTGNVMEIKGDKARVDGNKISVDGKYKKDEIILADTDGDKIQEIYKLGRTKYTKGTTVATYSDPSADEVYENIDILYYDDIDFEDIIIDEEKLYGNLKEIGIVDILFEDAYAATGNSEPEIEFELDKKKDKNGDEKTIVNIKIKWSEYMTALNLKFEVSNKIFYKNKNDTVVLNNVMTLGGSMQISVEGELGELKEKEIKKAIEKFVSLGNAKVKDLTYEVPIIPIKIPIYGPIYFEADIGLIGELELGGGLKFGIDNKITLTQGIIYDYNKTVIKKKYCEVIPSINSEVMLEGRAEAFAGFYVSGGVAIPLLVSVKAKGEAGPYFEAKGCAIIRDIPKNVKFEGYYNVETGVKFEAKINIELFTKYKEKIPLVEKKLPIWEKSNGKVLKEVDFRDTYYLDDNAVEIGEIHATYHDVLENEDIVETLHDYNFFVNETQEKIDSGMVAFDGQPGTYTFKVKWEDNKRPYEYEKQVKIEKVVIKYPAFIQGVWTPTMNNTGPAIDIRLDPDGTFYNMPYYPDWTRAGHWYYKEDENTVYLVYESNGDVIKCIYDERENILKAVYGIYYRYTD